MLDKKVIGGAVLVGAVLCGGLYLHQSSTTGELVPDEPASEVQADETEGNSVPTVSTDTAS